MKVDFEEMVEWEQRKASILIQAALRLGYNLSGEGEIGVNQDSGNIYLWLGEEPYILYMPIYCDQDISQVVCVAENAPIGVETPEIKLGEKTRYEIDEFFESIRD